MPGLTAKPHSPAQVVVTGPIAQRTLGLRPSQFHRLARAGVLPRAGKGLFDLLVVVPKFVQYLKDGRQTGEGMGAAKLALTRAQTKKLEVELRRTERLLVPIADASRAFDTAMGLVGAQLEGLASRMAAAMAAETDPAVVRKALFDECRRIRAAAAAELEAFANSGARRVDPAAAAGDDSV